MMLAPYWVGAWGYVLLVCVVYLNTLRELRIAAVAFVYGAIAIEACHAVVRHVGGS